jgi:ribosome-binding factor A
MSNRVAQVEAAVARVLSNAILELSDPRLPMIVSVERVRISSDLVQAKVFISCIGDSTAAVAALNHAKGFLQRQIAHEIQLKRTPLLEFFDARDDLFGSNKS